VRELTSKIAEMDREHVVLDMEAGVEHLSRGTARNTDVLLVIAEPYYKSLETAARVARLGQELGIARVYTVTNKVRGADHASMQQFIRDHSLDMVCEIGHDEEVAEADRLGIAPIDHDGKGILVTAIDALATRLFPA
jgi:CO dehydrogenase maturation factor